MKKCLHNAEADMQRMHGFHLILKTRTTKPLPTLIKPAMYLKRILPASDDDEVDVVDWDALEQEYGLWAKDKLGERYEADATGIGGFYSVLHFNSFKLITP